MAEKNVKLGKNVKIYHKQLINLYDCEIGSNCVIGSFVEIGKGAKIGSGVKIEAFSFIPGGVTLEDGVFIGPHVCFTNDKYPRAVNADGSLKSNREWKVTPTRVCQGASIGANSTILCGVTIGKSAIIGAGSVVTKNVPPKAVVAGNPAKKMKLPAALRPGYPLPVFRRERNPSEAKQLRIHPRAYSRGILRRGIK